MRFFDRVEEMEFLKRFKNQNGKHWLKAPDSKTYEFDIVGEQKDALIIFECKWKNKKASESALANTAKASSRKPYSHFLNKLSNPIRPLKFSQN